MLGKFRLFIDDLIQQILKRYVSCVEICPFNSDNEHISNWWVIGLIKGKK